ncbi:unnamed protein product [Thlaspi arvense]|uniref:Uncharacterized protein n=1 Tax=Thlaspi arvense TaxID=13288 RepID=A0AAU9SUU2_THLAR|nr:unnamed protein product [Thlaspi arvense]
MLSLDLWIPDLAQGKEIGQSNMNSPISISQLCNHNATNYSKVSPGLQMNYSVPTISKPNCNDQMVISENKKITIDATSGYKLFGVDLTAPTETKDLIEQIDLY